MTNDNKLYELRNSRHLTQKEFAEKAGLNTGVYSRYERKENDLPLSVAKKIAMAFDVSIDYIAGYSKNEQGIQVDKEQANYVNAIANPIIESAGNEKEILLGYIKYIEAERQKTITETDNAISQIQKILNDKYPNEQ